MRRYSVPKKRGGKMVAFLVIAIVSIVIIGVVLFNIRIQSVQRPHGEFKLLSIREVFQHAFGEANVQISLFGSVKVTGNDEMNNSYTVVVSQDGTIFIHINGTIQPNVEDVYKEIYTRALYKILTSTPLSDYESSDPTSFLSYLNNIAMEYYKENEKDYLRITGSDKEGNILKISYAIIKFGGKFKVTAEKLVINGKELNSNAMRVTLAKIYKKEIDKDLIEAIKNSFLKDFQNVSIGEVFSKLSNARWTIKDETKKVVELNGIEKIEESEVALTLGFRIDENGDTVIDYLLLNGEKIDEKAIIYYISYIYSKYGYADKEKDIAKFKDLILKSRLPNGLSTFQEFFDKHFSEVQWDMYYKPNSYEFVVSGKTRAKNTPVELRFISTPDGLYLAESVYGSEKAKSDIVINNVLNESLQVSQTNILSVVMNGKIVKYSPVQSNKVAFESFLKSPVWQYDSNADRVVLSGIGKYGSRDWNFKFVFETFFGKEPVLEYVYMDGTQAIDEVVDYVVSKVFRVETLGNNLSELVKNTIFTYKTYEEILGPVGWSIDRQYDRVVFSSSNLTVYFSVEPSGKVNVVQLFYKGQDMSTKTAEIVKLLEDGGSLESLEKKKTQQSQQPPQEEKEEQQPEAPQTGQF